VVSDPKDETANSQPGAEFWKSLPIIISFASLAVTLITFCITFYMNFLYKPEKLLFYASADTDKLYYIAHASQEKRASGSIGETAAWSVKFRFINLGLRSEYFVGSTLINGPAMAKDQKCEALIEPVGPDFLMEKHDEEITPQDVGKPIPKNEADVVFTHARSYKADKKETESGFIEIPNAHSIEIESEFIVPTFYRTDTDLAFCMTIEILDAVGQFHTYSYPVRMKNVASPYVIQVLEQGPVQLLP
jgi:hypothetical protein